MGFLIDNCVFAPLTGELLSRLSDFSCKHESDIADFFSQKAVPAAKELMSKSYCFFDPDTKDMVAAFCVLNATLPTEHLPNYARRALNKGVEYPKQRKQYPATLLAQLAVFDKYADKHVGDELMTFVLTWLHRNAMEMGNRFLVVDAINNEKVIEYYQRNDFRLMFRTDEEELIATGKNPEDSLSTRMMYYDLKRFGNS